MSYLGIEGEPVPERIILNYQPDLLQHALSLVDGQKRWGLKPGVYPLISKDGVVGMTLSPIGPTEAGKFMEELISRGARKFINIGIAGGLQRELSLGDIVVCNGAFMEGGENIGIDGNFVTRLRAGLVNQGLCFWEGKNWTVTSFDDETPERITKHRDRMILTVEMETASLASIARAHGLDFASAFVISDIVTPEETTFGFDKREIFEGLENLYRAALCSFTKF